MVRLIAAAFALLVLWAGPAAALTADEVLRLKKAGVSDETIQLMLKQEQSGRTGRQPPSPVSETSDEVVYRAGEGMNRRLEENRRREAEKERRVLDQLGPVIVDQRSRPQPLIPPSPGPVQE